MYNKTRILNCHFPEFFRLVEWKGNAIQWESFLGLTGLLFGATFIGLATSLNAASIAYDVNLAVTFQI